MGQDPVADLLRKAPASDAIRAQAWQAFADAADEDDFAARVKTLALPNTVKAQLWELKERAAPATVDAPDEPVTPDSTPRSSLAQRFMDQARQNAAIPVDLGIGALKGAGETIFGAGKLVRDYTPVGRLSDRIQPGAFDQRPPELEATNTAQGVGKFIEQGAEYLAPMGAVARITKGAPILKRMAAEGATVAGVAGVQSGGDKGTMASAGMLGAAFPPAGAMIGAGGRALQRAASGAREGGFGGATAKLLRSAAPAQPEMMVIQAIRPRSSRLLFKDNLGRSMPELKASEAALGRPITNISETLETVAHAKARVRADYDAIAGPKRAIGTLVDLTPVADAMVESVPKKLALENPKAVAAITRLADRYRTQVPVADAERYLVETNAELEAYFNKFPASRRASEAANPETALTVAQAKSLRDAIYRTLEHPGQGQSARELNKRYGALMEFEQELKRRIVPAQRAQPESVAEQISTAHAVGQIVRGAYQLSHGNVAGAANIAGGMAARNAATFMKEQQTTDMLLKRAFAAYDRLPSPVPMPPPTVIRGHLGPAKTRLNPAPDSSGPVPRLVTILDSERKRLGPAPDYITGQGTASAVRGVPAELARRDVRGALPPVGQTSGPYEMPPSSAQIQPNIPLSGRPYTPDESGMVTRVGAGPVFTPPAPVVPPRAAPPAAAVAKLKPTGDQAIPGLESVRAMERAMPEVAEAPGFSLAQEVSQRKAYQPSLSAADDVPDFIADAPVVDPKLANVERKFILRWLSDDLEALPYQPGGPTRGQIRAAYEDYRPGDAPGGLHGFVPAGRVAGTPTQEMFHALGIKGSRAEIAAKIHRAAIGAKNKTSLKLLQLSDALRRAWDGQRFDFQLLDDATIAELGVSRAQLKSPATMPNATDMPDAFERFFGKMPN